MTMKLPAASCRCSKLRSVQAKANKTRRVRPLDTTPFSPSAHRVCEQRHFEDLKIGEIFRAPSRTMTDAHFSAFQAVSGDDHPIHYDREYCKTHGHRDLLAHGFQVLSLTAPGAGLFPHVVGDSLIGFVEQSAKFLKPVYSGDTLYPALKIIDLKPQNTTGVVILEATVHNQAGELCLKGEHKLLVRKKDPHK
jgi:acyl dehydratase